MPMKRAVNREPIDNWVAENYPDAITKLASKSEVPASSIVKIRNGRVPKNADYRRRLADKLGISEDELFPPVKDDEEAAS